MQRILPLLSVFLFSICSHATANDPGSIPINSCKSPLERLSRKTQSAKTLGENYNTQASLLYKQASEIAEQQPENAKALISKATPFKNQALEEYTLCSSAAHSAYEKAQTRCSAETKENTKQAASGNKSFCEKRASELETMAQKANQDVTKLINAVKPPKDEDNALKQAEKNSNTGSSSDYEDERPRRSLANEGSGSPQNQQQQQPQQAQQQPQQGGGGGGSPSQGGGGAPPSSPTAQTPPPSTPANPFEAPQTQLPDYSQFEPQNTGNEASSDPSQQANENAQQKPSNLSPSVNISDSADSAFADAEYGDSEDYDEDEEDILAMEEQLRNSNEEASASRGENANNSEAETASEENTSEEEELLAAGGIENAQNEEEPNNSLASQRSLASENK